MSIVLQYKVVNALLSSPSVCAKGYLGGLVVSFLDTKNGEKRMLYRPSRATNCNKNLWSLTFSILMRQQQSMSEM